MRRKVGIAIAVALAWGAALSAQGGAIAFLGTVNSGGDPRLDYLPPFITGIVLYDLSSQSGMTLVDRSSLEDVLREQEVSLALGSGDAVKLGKVLGARWISRAEFTAVGADIALTLHLIDAESSQAFVYADRGSDENLVHGLVERLVKKASGKDVALRTDLTERSLTSLRDEKPGSISLHTRLVDAEILLDGKFAGYSTGDIRKPFVIEDLDPGTHEIMIKLRGFGRVRLPEVNFEPWTEKVKVRSGKNEVVKSDAGMYSDLYYDLVKLREEEIKFANGTGKNEKEGTLSFDFTDRAGKGHKVSVSYRAERDESGGTMVASISYDGQAVPLSLACKPDKEAELKARAGPLSLKASINLRSSAFGYFVLLVERNDIAWGEWEK
jgi:hypothetical protein